MNINERNMVLNWVKGKFTTPDFIKQYPFNLNEPDEYILNGLENACTECLAEDVELFLLLFPISNLWRTNNRYANILCKLLLEEWHISHENIVSLLQGLKNPDTVECLYKASFLELDYLDYDDTFALARKCIHALADINTENSREKLKLLAMSDILIIKEKAERQLYKR